MSVPAGTRAKRTPLSPHSVYLVTMSRYPEMGEVAACLDHVALSPDARKGWEDVHWALINTKEFLFRH